MGKKANAANAANAPERMVSISENLGHFFNAPRHDLSIAEQYHKVKGSSRQSQ